MTESSSEHLYRASRNSMFMILGRLSTFVFGIFTAMLLARYAGPELYGVYGYASSMLIILMVLVNLGMNTQVTRDVSKNPGAWRNYLLASLIVKTTLLILVLVGTYITVQIFSDHPQNNPIYLLVGLSLGFAALASSISSLVYAFEKMRYDAGYVLLRSSLTAVAVMVTIFLGMKFVHVLSGIVIIAICAFIFYSLMIYRFLARNQPVTGEGMDSRWWKMFIRSGVVFSLIAILGAVYSNLAIILVKKLALSAKETGYYFASFRIYEYGMFIPQVLYTSLIPTYTKVFSESKDLFQRSFRKVYGYGLCLALIIAAGLSASAEPIIRILYGAEYLEAVPVMRLLGIAVLNMTGFLVSPALVAMGKEKWMIGMVGGALTLFVILSVLLIPSQGALGAGIAFMTANLMSFLVVTIVAFIATKASFPWKPVLKTLPVALIIFAALFLSSSNLVYFFAVIPGVIVFIILFVRYSGVVEPQDLESIKASFAFNRKAGKGNSN